MAETHKQNQIAGDQSTNIQARSVAIHQHNYYSPKPDEVKQELTALFEANFLRLQSLARTTAEERATAITERFLSELMSRNQAGLAAAQDPDVQAAIFTAQRDYARSGRDDLEQVLVDLLVERATATDLARIVLNEAITVAPKLTEAQLDTLSLILVFVHCPPLGQSFDRWSDLAEYLNCNVGPFINEALKSDATFSHLKYTGCISMDSSGMTMLSRITQRFGGSGHLSPTWHEGRPLPGQVSYFDSLRTIEPRLNILDEIYAHGSSPLDIVQLTTVGIALANANLRRRTGQAFDLATWIR